VKGCRPIIAFIVMACMLIYVMTWMGCLRTYDLDNPDDVRDWEREYGPVPENVRR